jgi:hypothetical protein
MQSFLNGYLFSNTFNNIEALNEFPPFWYFHEWAMVNYNRYELTAGWKERFKDEKEIKKSITKLFGKLKWEIQNEI